MYSPNDLNRQGRSLSAHNTGQFRRQRGQQHVHEEHDDEEVGTETLLRDFVFPPSKSAKP